MHFLTNLRISTRLAIGFGLVLFLSVVSTSFALLNARNNLEATRLMMEKPLAKERLISDWYVLTYSAIARTSMIARSSDDTLSTTFKDVIADSVKQGSATMKGIEPLLSGTEEKALYQNIVEIRKKYQSSKELVMNSRKSGDASAGEHAYTDVFMPTAKDYQNKVLELLSLQRNSIDQTARAIAEASEHGTRLLILLSVLLIAIGVIAGIVISRSITKPLKNAIQAARLVAAGDLTNPINRTGADEIGDLMQALHDMNESLVNIVSQVQTGTHAITNAATEIATGNLDLSSRTEQQASSLEETAASIEELTATVKQNAENARQANQLVINTSDVASKGGGVVSQVIETMSSINESAKKIVDIIGVIDGIAFQTNILALNAAVEAARAGEQGRGFAVVASEVRNLAQRSAGAAKEIKALINDSVSKVGVGSALVDQAGSTMSEVVASVKRVTDIMAEITAASQEQSIGIEQVNRAIIEMDHTTQQNAALVEQAAAAAESMQDQAAALTNVVDIFKVNGSGAVAPTARQSAAIRPPVQKSAAAIGNRPDSATTGVIIRRT